MSYFGKYNGKYAGSWWGGIIAFIKGKATSFARVLNLAANSIRGLFQSKASDSTAIITTTATAPITQTTSNQIATAQTTSQIVQTIIDDSEIFVTHALIASSGGNVSSSLTSNAKNAIKSTSTDSNDKTLTQGVISDV